MRETLEEINITFRQQCFDYVQRDILPYVKEWEQQRYVPFHLIKEWGEKKLFAPCTPGTKAAFEAKRILAGALGSSRSMGTAATIMNHLNIPLWILNEKGSAYIKNRYLKPSIAGEAIGAIAITEPVNGSDLLHSTQTRCTMENDEIILNGGKHFILNLPGADFILVLARSSNRSDVLGFSLVVVPSDTPGVRVNRIQTTGLHTAALGEVQFEDCRIPLTHLVGDWHKGFMYIGAALTDERLIGSIVLMGLIREVLKDTYQFINERPFMKGKLGELQAIRHKMADMSAEFEIAAAYLDEVCELWPSKSSDVQTKAAMAKFVCSEAAQKIVDGCLQLWGGRGFLDDCWISRAYRDSFAASSFAGSTEILKDIVAERILL